MKDPNYNPLEIEAASLALDPPPFVLALDPAPPPSAPSLAPKDDVADDGTLTAILVKDRTLDPPPSAAAQAIAERMYVQIERSNMDVKRANKLAEAEARANNKHFPCKANFEKVSTPHAHPRIEVYRQKFKGFSRVHIAFLVSLVPERRRQAQVLGVFEAETIKEVYEKLKSYELRMALRRSAA